MAFSPSHKKRHKTDAGEVRLQLTSMMDMFTIILVFLLKTYSTHGQLINPSQDLTLPTSMIQHDPEVGMDVTVSTDWTLVNGRPVIRTPDIQKKEGYLIPELQQELLRYAREAMHMQEQYGAQFSGKVTIQGDKHLPYRLLIKVMYTCGQSNYPNMRLVVYTKE
jgi:biopolymer transport protein ExbD